MACEPDALLRVEGWSVVSLFASENPRVDLGGIGAAQMEAAGTADGWRAF